ncbi:spherulin-1A [Colletotrichum sojae]|uniref:Spherulin-1A n=1 Tax=Colletotrichum sojae TaxID=2175907 RepID=A0A8H6J0E1_9PEZI|nr:spherulin-1A [Colletotrichum sojae]
MHSSTILSSILFAAAALAAPAPAALSPRFSDKSAASTSHASETSSIDDALPPIVPVNTRTGNSELITKLMTAPTQQDRVRLLNQPGDFVFDFNDAGAPEGSESRGKGGFSTSATAKTFPALIGNGAAMTLAFLGPCGMNTAHVHNRATELNVVVKGRLVTNFQVENGVDPVANTMELYQMSVFPQGAIHQEFNPDCEDAVFVAGFNNADPGVEQVAQTFFGLRPEVVSATLGGAMSFDGADLESFREHIPANIALGIDACLNKCGIKRNAKRDINEIFAAARK